MPPLNPHTWPLEYYDAFFLFGVVGFGIPLLIVGALRLRGLKSRRLNLGLLAGSLAMLLFLNPIAQLLTLGPIDRWQRDSWMTKAREEQLVGKGPDAVVAAFGQPCQKRDEHPAISGPDGWRYVSEPYTAWDYAPVPLFLFAHGGHFKVFFSEGLVTGVKRGD